MYTTTQIYDALKNLKTNVLSSTRYGTTTSIFGVTGTFEPTVQLGDYCGSNDECYTGYCGYDQDWNQACTNGITGVDLCYDGAGCKDGYCDPGSVCSSGVLGSYCDSSDDCVSGHCDNANIYACTDGSVGSNCSDNYGCASPNICDTGTYTCVDGSNGAACTSALGCSSGHCYGDVCTAGITDSSMCDSGDDCESGFCNTVDNLCSSGAPGSNCFEGIECSTYNCGVDNKCSADLPPITSGLIGYWSLNESSGTTITDSSSGAHNLTSANTTVVSGILGNARNFNGTSGKLSYATNVPFNPSSGSFTAGAWVQTTSTGHQYVMGTTPEQHPYLGWVILQYNQRINVWISDNGGVTLTANTPIYDNNWHYVAFTINRVSNMVTLYIDGAMEQTLPYTGSIGGQAGEFRVGSRYLQPGLFWNGKIDEPAIWNRPLAPAEITALYNNGAGMSITP